MRARKLGKCCRCECLFGGTRKQRRIRTFRGQVVASKSNRMQGAALLRRLIALVSFGIDQRAFKPCHDALRARIDVTDQLRPTLHRHKAHATVHDDRRAPCCGLHDTRCVKAVDRHALVGGQLIEIARRQSDLKRQRKKSLVWGTCGVQSLKDPRMSERPLTAAAQSHAIEGRLNLARSLREVRAEQRFKLAADFQFERHAFKWNRLVDSAWRAGPPTHGVFNRCTQCRRDRARRSCTTNPDHLPVEAEQDRSGVKVIAKSSRCRSFADSSIESQSAGGPCCNCTITCGWNGAGLSRTQGEFAKKRSGGGHCAKSVHIPHGRSVPSGLVRSPASGLDVANVTLCCV